jgi:hypothetical protein
MHSGAVKIRSIQFLLSGDYFFESHFLGRLNHFNYITLATYPFLNPGLISYSIHEVLMKYPLGCHEVAMKLAAFCQQHLLHLKAGKYLV